MQSLSTNFSFTAKAGVDRLTARPPRRTRFHRLIASVKIDDTWSGILRRMRHSPNEFGLPGVKEDYQRIMRLPHIGGSRFSLAGDRQHPPLESSIPLDDQPQGTRTPTCLFALYLSLAFIVSGAVPRANATDLPDNIEIKQAVTVASVHAEGVQIYECKMGSDNTMSWQFREPLATLLRDGATVGRHFVGPSWEFSDGSSIKAKVVDQAPGATQNDIAILRLEVVEHRGDGALLKVTAVQRLDTKGGVFSGACDRLDAMHLEPYTARYVFLN